MQCLLNYRIYEFVIIVQNYYVFLTRGAIFTLDLLFLEVLGAIMSVMIIWVMTGVLMYKAVERIVNGEHSVNANIMLIVASCGVGVNIV